MAMAYGYRAQPSGCQGRRQRHVAEIAALFFFFLVQTSNSSASDRQSRASSYQWNCANDSILDALMDHMSLSTGELLCTM